MERWAIWRQSTQDTGRAIETDKKDRHRRRMDGFQMFKYIAALQKLKAAESAYLYDNPDADHSEVADLYNVYGMIFGFAEHITK